jgi:hypothetical protein
MNRRGPTRFLYVHTFTVDASWGYLYGEDAAGVQRRELVYDKKAGKWWDLINGKGRMRTPSVRTTSIPSRECTARR